MSLSALFDDLHAAWALHGRAGRNLAVYAVLTYRFGRWALDIEPAPLRWLTGKVYGACATLVELGTGIAIAREAQIGNGLFLAHAGNIHIHPEAVLGDNVTLFHDVTIGTNTDREGAPVIGDDVNVGPGAKILGPVKVGAGARIGACSLVISDVPPYATAIGVPARALRHTPAAVMGAA